MAAEAIGQATAVPMGFEKFRPGRLIKSFLVGACIVCPATLARDYCLDYTYNWLRKSHKVSIEEGLEFDNLTDARKVWPPTMILYGIFSSFPFYIGFHLFKIISSLKAIFIKLRQCGVSF